MSPPSAAASGFCRCRGLQLCRLSRPRTSAAGRAIHARRSGYRLPLKPTPAGSLRPTALPNPRGSEAADQASKPDQSPGRRSRGTDVEPAAPSAGEAEPEAAEPASTGNAKCTGATRMPAAARHTEVGRSQAFANAPADSFEDRLVADGEKYLYGRGVPETARGRREICRSAREQSNAKAQTLLGAMYATGHCVSRDLPTAYRWFAKALHGDPGIRGCSVISKCCGNR